MESSCCLGVVLLYIRDMAKAEWGWSKQDPEWMRSSDHLSSEDHESPKLLSVEDKKALLTTEHLSQLSLGEYLALWRKLHPHALTKVSRHGFLDYTIDRFQSWDMFHYFSDFERELENGKLLRGRLHQRGVMDGSPERVQVWLGSVLEEPTKEMALEKLREKLGIFDGLPYLSGAISAAMDTKVSLLSLHVLPEAYGAERRNAVFTVFPTDVVLSQHRFQLSRPTALWVRGLNQTVDVWPNPVQHGGLSQDAGIVFLPKSAEVDPQTGSRYASQPTDAPLFSGDVRRMIENTDVPILFQEQMNRIPEVRGIVGAVEQDWQTGRNGEVEKRVEEFRERFPALLQNLGYHHSEIDIIVKRSCDRLAYGKNPFDPDFLLMTLAFSGTLFERPKETISSQEFWERRFTKHPEQKPSRVVYYEGNPAEALNRFLKAGGIETPQTKPKAGHLLGFDDHLVSDLARDPQLMQTAQALWNLCVREIEARYSSSTA